MKKKSSLSSTSIAATSSLKFSKGTLYDQLVEETKMLTKQADEFTIKEFCKDTGMSDTSATRFIERKIFDGTIVDRKVSGNRYYKFVKVTK